MSDNYTYQVTIEAIVARSGTDPGEWPATKLLDYLSHNVAYTEISSVRLVPAPAAAPSPEPALQRQSQDHLVAPRKAKPYVRRSLSPEIRPAYMRKRAHRPRTDTGAPEYCYRSAEYMRVARVLSVGTQSRRKGKKCVWLTDAEQLLVRSRVTVLTAERAARRTGGTHE
jgi:hypothetical protein